MLGSKANVMNAISKTSEFIEEKWAFVSNSPCQIILITDSSSRSPFFYYYYYYLKYY